MDLQTPGLLAGFAYLADGIKRHGAVASVELSHSGQYAGTYLVDKDKQASLCQYGPSDGMRPDGIPVQALSQAQIKEIVCAYGESAALAKRAGFEMVMVDALRDGAPFVRVVGDCQRPANIMTAMYTAYHAAMDI